MWLIVSSEVEDDLKTAALLLEENRKGYGEKLIRAYQETITLIEKYPFSNRIRIKKSRAVQLPRFSYLLVYQVYSDTILVQRMIHVKRSLRKRYGG